MTNSSRPLTPKDRVVRTMKGVSIQFGTHPGVWVLPYAVYARAYDQVRDRMYESIVGRGTVAHADILVCAYSLLALAYEVSDEEAATLIRAADQKQLTDTVLACLMGEDDPVRSYSNWVRSGLEANRLDPESIPPEDLPHVLFQLQSTGRMVPLEQYSHIEMHKAKVASLLSHR